MTQAIHFAAVTKPSPVFHPPLASISLRALEAITRAMIAQTIGHTAQETIANTKAMIAFWEVWGAAAGTPPGYPPGAP